MKKYNILVRKGKEHSTEGYRLKELVNNCFMDDIVQQEEMVSKMRADINNCKIPKMETLGRQVVGT
eukprot:1952658-Heterocapsa_arctica.AAC.1